MKRTCKFTSWIAALAVLSLLLASPAPTRAADLYVDATNGSNATGDGSQANPYRTLEFAIDQANTTGDTIHLAGGTYSGGFYISGKALTISGPVTGPTLLDVTYNTAVLDGGTTNTVVFVDYDSTATLSGLVIQKGSNTADILGGGVENFGAVTLSQCLVLGCQAGYGGGVANLGRLTVDRSAFGFNNAELGGAIENGIGTPNTSAVISNSYFSLNEALGGGAVSSVLAPLTMANCALVANYSGELGGALLNFGPANLYNSTFAFNQCQYIGGAIANGFPDSGPSIPSTLAATNCILWQDTATSAATNEIYSVPGDESDFTSTATVAYSDVDGGLPVGVIDGGHNIDADPQFASNSEIGVDLASASLCINAGDNSVVTAANGFLQTANQYVDILDNPRITGGTVDMGAVEYISAVNVTDANATRHGTHHVTVTAQLLNPNAVTDLDVTVTAASLGGTNTISVLPIYYGTIKAGNSKLCTLQFTDIPSGDQTLTIIGTSSLGPFSTTQTVTVP